MVIRAFIFLVLVSASIPAAAQTQTSVEELARTMDYIHSNADEIVGEETVKSLPRVVEQGQQKYAEELQQTQALNAELFEQGVELAQEMARSQYDAVEQAGHLPSSANPNSQGDTPTRFRIFITQRMPDAEVKKLIEMYQGRPDIALVLRGMLPGQTMMGVHSWIYRLLQPIKEGMPVPNITMDPTPFNDLGVDQVPVIAKYDDGGELQAFALGMTSAAWLEERVQGGATGNLGVYGPTVQVAEEDILQVIMRKAKAFDWAGSAEGAVDRYWATTTAHDLPTVHTRKVMTLDPTFEITKDIIAPDGTAIARAGDRVNPLELTPFTQLLFFFDPADPEQVQWIKAQVAANQGRSMVVMASQLRTLDGLEGLGEMSDTIGARIFMLPKDVRARFSIERVPTKVWAEGTMFVLNEQLPSDRPETP